MASQQILFAETIAAMKKAAKRKAYESDSDEEIDHQSNRGHKFKKRARFVREGQLAPPSGPEVYREIVNHAGYQRAIISRNPLLVDEEGYELDSDDDEDDRIKDIIEEAAQFNPYANVRLENILAPLTAVTDLPTHPTLSRPYTSKTLTDLTEQARIIMQKENSTLWKIKPLQTKLNGDHIWAPCEMMLGPNDLDLYQDEHAVNGTRSLSKGSTKSESSMHLLENSHRSTNGHASINGKGSARDEDTSIVDADASTNKDKGEPNAAGQHLGESLEKVMKGTTSQEDKATDKSSKTIEVEEQKKTEGSRPEKAPAEAGDKPMTNGMANSVEHNIGPNNLHAFRRPHNCKEANEGGSGPASTISEITDALYIHPLFLVPRAAHPDRDLGIPDGEAEDLRRLLQLMVQKQEEVCRGAKQLYEGLLRADKLRRTVLQWSKYEAHVGPSRDMSDGEDWYDKEEWGLDEDLKKGQDEEEEETNPNPKKTRNRRN